MPAFLFYQQAVTPPPPPSRKSAPGHYITVGRLDPRRGTYWKGTPNLLTYPGLRGIHLRLRWSELESTQGNYTFGTVESSYPDSERTVRAELWRCAQNNSRLILMMEDKTFDGSNPMPAYLQSDTYVRPNNGGGYTAVRYNSFVQTRFRALIAALGAAFDAHANFYGMSVQETALGFPLATRTATGYTDVGYRDSLTNNLKAASDAFPTSNIFWFTNFFPTPDQDYRLQEVADALRDYNGGDSGVIMGGPDILPDNYSIKTRVYPRFGDPPVGSWGELPLFNSMQFDSYSHVHTTATPDARLPGDVWSIEDYWTMDQLFRFGRDRLHLNYVLWDHSQYNSHWTFEANSAPVIAAYPTFNAS